MRRVPLTTRWAIAILAIILAVGPEGLFSRLLLEDSPYPSGAVVFIKRHGLHGNLLSNFNWGEYLIWHLGPDSKVFIDGRYDTVYSLRVIHDYFKFHFQMPGAMQVLSSYPHDLVIVPSFGQTYHFMESISDWKLIYRDPDAAIFAPRDSLAGKLPGTPVLNTARSNGYFP